MAIPASFLQLLRQQKRKSLLTGVPQGAYDYAVAGAEGASGRLATERAQRLSEAAVETQAGQFTESLAQSKLQFGESLAEQKRASLVQEKEAGLTREGMMSAAEEARKMQLTGMAVQAPLSVYATGKLMGLGATETGKIGMQELIGERIAAQTATETGGVAAGEAAGIGQIGTGAMLYAGGELAGQLQPKVKEIPKETEKIAKGAGIGMAVGGPIGAGVGAGYGAISTQVPELWEPVEFAESIGGKVVNVFTGGGCIIITACTSPDSYEVNIAREYRDKHLDQVSLRGYYMIAEKVVPVMEKYGWFRKFIKWSLVDSLIAYGKWSLGKGETSLVAIIITKIFLGTCKFAGLMENTYTRKNGEVW
ncbi:hypothetical protein ES708_04636 [subsurface metagenome]